MFSNQHKWSSISVEPSYSPICKGQKFLDNSLANMLVENGIYLYVLGLPLSNARLAALSPLEV